MWILLSTPSAASVLEWVANVLGVKGIHSACRKIQSLSASSLNQNSNNWEGKPNKGKTYANTFKWPFLVYG